VPGPEVDDDPNAAVALVAYGTSHWAALEARDELRREYGLPTGYLRLRAYPFSDEVAAFLGRYERVYLVEQNRDAQMRALMRIELPPALTARIRSVRHYDGLPIDARSITDAVVAQEGVGGAAAAQKAERSS